MKNYYEDFINALPEPKSNDTAKKFWNNKTNWPKIDLNTVEGQVTNEIF